MGSTLPKWRIKQKRQRTVAARQAARKKMPGERNLGVVRVARHGGPNKAAHP